MTGVVRAAVVQAIDAGLEPGFESLLDELIAMQWSLDGSQQEAMFLVLCYALLAMTEGSSCFAWDKDSPFGEFVKKACRHASSAGQARKVLRQVETLAQMTTLEGLIGASSQNRPLIVHDGRFHVQRLWFREKRISQWFINRKFSTDSRRSDVAMQGLSDEQSHAVAMAAAAPVSIITGGPGTGKTTVISALVSRWLEKGLPESSIHIAAPTGKAAHRLSKSLGEKLGQQTLATLGSWGTLHSLLEYSPRVGFRRSKKFPLEAQAVVVDEASMVDLVLLEALCDALLADCRLVLVGDVEQLPPIDAGAPFSDLVSAWPNVATLRKNFRVTAGGQTALLKAISEIASGGTADLQDAASADGDMSLSLSAVTRPEQLYQFLDTWMKSMGLDDMRGRAMRLSWPAEPTDAIRQQVATLAADAGKSQLLAVTRLGRRGTEAINRGLLARAGLSRIDVGVPVMVTRNDYQLGVFNGDVGLTLAGEDGEMQVALLRGDGELLVLPAMLLRLVVAYAITVHKAQGSEYDHVALLLPAEASRCVSRPLVYTAITRARQRAWVVGSRGVWQAGLQNRLTRETALGTLVKRGAPLSQRSLELD